MNIHSFIARPWQCAKQGYQFCLLDCWAVNASNVGAVFRGYWKHVREIEDVLHMTIKELIVWLFMAVVLGVVVLTYPFLYWMWGTILYYRLKRIKNK